MSTHAHDRWSHDHEFGMRETRSGERRTWWVIGITTTMMVVEIVGGTVFGSMALLADGWHMGTHAAALGITLFAYVFARRHAGDPRFTFGTGKVSALGGFASAVGLAVVAVLVFGESVVRLATPVDIHFDQAIAVAVVGLLVNVASALILRDHDHGHGHSHGRHPHDGHDPYADHDHHHDHDHDGVRHHDHNLRGAYLHVLADALTSVLAIGALLAGRQLGWGWMDPLMGVVGSVVIGTWAFGLLRDSGAVLVDAETTEVRQRSVREAVEAGTTDRVVDLHVWRVGPRHMAAIIVLVTDDPRPPGHYRARLAGHEDLAHVTVEVHDRRDIDAEARSPT